MEKEFDLVKDEARAVRGREVSIDIEGGGVLDCAR